MKLLRAHVKLLREHVKLLQLLRAHVKLLREHVKLLRAHVKGITCAHKKFSQIFLSPCPLRGSVLSGRETHNLECHMSSTWIFRLLKCHFYPLTSPVYVIRTLKIGHVTSGVTTG